MIIEFQYKDYRATDNIIILLKILISALNYLNFAFSDKNPQAECIKAQMKILLATNRVEGHANTLETLVRALNKFSCDSQF